MGIELFLYNSPAFKNFLQNNPHERGEVKFLKSIAEEGMNAIDIGANIGITSMSIAKRIGRRGNLYSFEPVPEYFNILEKNISSNRLENVKAYELAVTDQVGKAYFYQKGLSSGVLFEKGVDYFAPDPVYRFELELHVDEEKRVLSMAYTKAQEQDFLRWGEFRLKIGSEEQAIQAYKSDPSEERLFILFRDATSGKETYGAGRYLDLEPARDRTAEGKWILDFNKAYNPRCVYSEDYTCPLVPPENWLEVPTRAGEKNYSSKVAH